MEPCRSHILPPFPHLPWIFDSLRMALSMKREHYGATGTPCHSGPVRIPLAVSLRQRGDTRCGAVWHQHRSAAAAPEIHPFMREEAAWFLETVRQHTPRRCPLFLCALRTSRRLGELLELQWGDIDFHAVPMLSHTRLLYQGASGA